MDESESFAPHVLYVDLPTGQVSWHCTMRGSGPDYGDDWDGMHLSESRILEFAESLFPAEDISGSEALNELQVAL